MLSYSYFADFYDELTQNVNYEEEAHYILKLAERELLRLCLKSSELIYTE